MTITRKTYIATPRSTHVWTTSEVKAHLVVEHSSDDTYIDALLAAAESAAEVILRRSLLETEIVLEMSGFPCNRDIELDLGPVQTIDSFTYYDTNGSSQTVSASIYTNKLSYLPPTIRLDPNESWPDYEDERVDAVTIGYTAGWASASVVPTEIRVAILQLVAHWYSIREPVVIGGGVNKVPLAAEQLLWMHRDLRF